MEQMIIRRGVAGDASRISKVLLDSFLEFRKFYTGKAFAATTITEDEVVKRMEEGVVWVAEKEKIVGTAAVVKNENDLYIRGMAVLPGDRESKTGWKLLETVEMYAVENNFKSLLLSTTPYLTAAIHFYEKFGFKKIGETDNSFYGTLIFRTQKILTT